MPQFSIIIPVYNAEKNIRVCLEKIEKQTFKDYDLIIINDGSSDSSQLTIDEYISTHSATKIQSIYKRNGGAGSARNIGIDAAQGEYIVFIDADDYVDNNYLKELDLVIKEQNADLIFVDIVREDGNQKIIRYERMSDYRNITRDQMIRWQLTGKIPWGGVRKVVKTSLIKNNAIKYATSIKVGEESIYSFKALYNATKIAFQTQALYHYVECSTSLTSNDSIENSQSVFEFIKESLKESPEYKKFDDTISALAVTTVIIGINVLMNKNEKNIYSKSLNLINKYESYFHGKIDEDSLDMRIKLCKPWILMGWPLPIIIASKLQKIYKRIK